MSLFRALLASALTASLSTAHVVLENPKPYKFVSDGATNPLSSTGSDFPCKIPPGQSYVIDGEPTPMTIGEDQTVSFLGQAVHGGGSCQLALSHGFPTKDSSWLVIHSIEGGCPARNQKGNLDGPNTDKYTFQIPEGIAPGTNYTLAWVWINRIAGQDEIYMNCAPISILANSKKRMSLPARRDAARSQQRAPAPSFPDLFLANLGDFTGGCTTTEAQREQLSIAYPDPGASIERADNETLFQQPCDGNPRARKPAGGSGGNGTSPTTPSSSSSAAASSNPASSTSSVSASISTSSAAAETDATSTVVVTVTPTVTTLLSVTAAPTSSPGNGTSASHSYSALPSGVAGRCMEGYLTCLGDGTHFATCTGGQLTAAQPIAPGFTCRPGEGVGLDISPM
ncbi:hypothetical protein F5Y10DRAFT_281177 [Nemania abortiva]|nr:hypothetical protein F5Y10DRAFT_281177 [Nemania abortiva]